MTYVELYKKYRPKGWAGIIGQDSAVKQIKEAIKNNRVPTAYSFSGPAGTGKTTIAKVIAKTLNCPNVGEDLEPCNECPTCRAIDSDTLIGVQYFSMANNGEVDTVRRIVQDAQTKVAINKKVIIIDEYHNLSPKGFDALLIPLEKENMNALFIFCTTELDKIRPAVLSRTQNISLKPVKQKDLAKNLIEIAKKLPDVTFLFVGEGPDRIFLEANSKELINVIFTGKREDAYKFYSAFDIFAFPSLYEGFPMVLIEAQCSGVNIIMNETIDSTTQVANNICTALPLDKNKWIDYIQNVQVMNNKRDFDERLMAFDINQNIINLKEIYQKGLKK